MEWMWPALFVGARALPSDLPAVHLPVAHAVAMDDLLSRFEPGYVPNRRSLSDPPDEKGDWASGDSSSGEPSFVRHASLAAAAAIPTEERCYGHGHACGSGQRV